MSSGFFSSFYGVPLPQEQRSKEEERWVSFQPYLLSKGYQLRPRYQPDWIPSWKISGARPSDCEDSLDSMPVRVLDAIRIKDQLQVVIKMLVPSDSDREGAEELQILQHFSTSLYCNNPSNHSVPCLDSFPIPERDGGTFFVMPLLSEYTDPPFFNLSELHDFLTQIFEGLEFLHSNHVAHCDIAPANIMMNKRPLYDEAFHPVWQHRSLANHKPIWPKYTRSNKPVRYYYIDFGYSKWFRDPNAPRTLVGSRAKEAAPEQANNKPYDPFKGDIYQLGAVLRRDLIPKHEPLSFLLPLAREMTNSDPNKRPTLQSAFHTMNTHFVGLPGWRKRWPLIPPDTAFGSRLLLILAGLSKEVAVTLKRILNLLLMRY